ncbi:hypothetical protein HNP73_000123 [Amaricoccus macauensis]|uniref:Uncharacterized protein n=1 Tax=Amaricoccus macauensis TaxID=57001 RepID=A0A840SLG9_9RHOB|nr:hypothetical protein [Amaricoccus macauensis]MBB5220202.1 hypothetical protein [Amaricoccus macauensis]
MTKVRVWLSHDGYRDPDDNLAMLVGAAKARQTAKSDPDISIAGLIFGDTTDGGQFHMVHPIKNTPSNMDGDPRFDELAKNKIAAGNYLFFKQYAKPALEKMAPGWAVIDSVQGEVTSSWNYNAQQRSGLSHASRELVSDIISAIGKGGGNNPKEVVVYSAGGGAHVPAEAIGYLRNEGFTDAKIKQHFAIVQHGRTNFASNLEPEARNITRTFTIPIAKQDLDKYANGMDGPGLGKLVRGGIFLEGNRFGAKMAEALDVAQGLKKFENIGPGKTFKTTIDGSDAGSHAFAVNDTRLLANWDNRLKAGETLSAQVGHEHQVVKAGGGYRLRVMFNDFDWKDARALMNGNKAGADASATTAVATALEHDDNTPAEKLSETLTEVKVAAAELVATDADTGEGGEVAALLRKAGPALSLGEADVFAFASDGSATTVVAENGRIGVADIGKPSDIERSDAGSEKLLVDLGESSDLVAVVVAGLSKRGSAHEAAEITAYAEDGSLIGTKLVEANGRTELGFGEEVRYATIEAAEWQGEGALPEANPDLSLIWIEAL